MFLDIKLAHQGLVLISIPLIFELVFVWTLTTLQRQTEQEAFQANRSKEVTAEVDLLYALFYQGAAANVAASLRNGGLETLEFDRIAREIDKHLRDLRALVADDPARSGAIGKLTALADESLELLLLARDAIKDKNIQGLDVTKTQHTIEALMQELRQLTASEKETQRLAPVREAHYRRLVQLCIAGGCVVSIVMALALVLLFNKITARRVAVLLENTDRLALGQGLPPAMSGGGELVQLDHVFHDMAGALERSAAKEKEIEQIKKQFVAMLAHDLRTPLTSLQLLLSMLADGMYGQLPERAGGELGKAESELVRLVGIINDLLAIEKMESGSFDLVPERFVIDKVVQSSVNALAALAHDTGIELVVATEPVLVEADERRLVQVLVNLMSNAIKYSSRGSKVEITAHGEGAWCRLSVRDYGKGIPEKFREVIFERYKQVEAEDAAVKGGTGLGLPICKEIVEKHNGQIGVDSQLGQGSTFWFRIPVVAD